MEELASPEFPPTVLSLAFHLADAIERRCPNLRYLEERRRAVLTSFFLEKMANSCLSFLLTSLTSPVKHGKREKWASDLTLSLLSPHGG